MKCEYLELTCPLDTRQPRLFGVLVHDGHNTLSIFQPSSSILIEVLSVQYPNSFSMSLPTSPVPLHSCHSRLHLPFFRSIRLLPPFLIGLKFCNSIFPINLRSCRCNQRTSKSRSVHTIGEFMMHRLALHTMIKHPQPGLLVLTDATRLHHVCLHANVQVLCRICAFGLYRRERGWAGGNTGPTGRCGV